eukprot:m.184195 g.184195  ORF g.184195 m.184195 type:complete len:64 (+) comp39318_c4_seq6:615-806(+)
MRLGENQLLVAMPAPTVEKKAKVRMGLKLQRRQQNWALWLGSNDYKQKQPQSTRFQAFEAFCW